MRVGLGTDSKVGPATQYSKVFMQKCDLESLKKERKERVEYIMNTAAKKIRNLWSKHSEKQKKKKMARKSSRLGIYT